MSKARKVVEIPPGEAVFIVEALVLDGKLPAKAFAEYRSRYQEEISTLSARIAHLRALAAPISTMVVGAVATAPAVQRGMKRAAAKIKTKVKAAVSPERARSRQLQGKYLGLMRQIPKGVMKKQFGKDAIATRGKERVIVEMERYLAKKR